MSAGFKYTAAQVITSNRHMAAMAMKGLNFSVPLCQNLIPSTAYFNVYFQVWPRACLIYYPCVHVTPNLRKINLKHCN